jgi:hypothetical protein
MNPRDVVVAAFVNAVVTITLVLVLLKVATWLERRKASREDRP